MFGQPQNNNIIFTVDTAVGSGKTFTAIKYMLAIYNTKINFIYVAPRKDLCNQVEKIIREQELTGRPVKNIHSGISHNATIDALISIEATDPDSGTIHIITTVTFIKLLSQFQYQRHHALIFDEAFEPSSHTPYYSRNNLSHCTNLFIEQQDGRVVPNKEKERIVSRIANEDFGNDLYEYKNDELIEMCKRVTNPAIWCEYADRSKTSIVLATYLAPDRLFYFYEVIFLSALFSHSILYRLWSEKFQVDFREHRYFEVKNNDGVLYDTHKFQGPKIRIWYLLEKNDSVSRNNLQRNYKTGKDNERKPEMRVINHLNETVNRHFGQENYLLVLNTWSEDVGRQYENAEVIRTKEHGSNNYKDFTNVAVLASTNPHNEQATWLADALGITKSELYNIYNLETAYQAFGRCAIRNRNNEERIQLVVLSYDIATKINDIFSGSTLVGQLGNLPNLRSLQRANSNAKLGRPKSNKALRRNKDYQSITRRINRLSQKEPFYDVDREKLIELEQHREYILLQ